MTVGNAERLVEITAFAAVNFQFHPLANTSYVRCVPAAIRHVGIGENNPLLAGSKAVTELKPAISNLMNIVHIGISSIVIINKKAKMLLWLGC